MRAAIVTGFSLIELMVAVAIVGILTTIAYPAYNQYVVDGHRSNAEQFLMDLAQRQEQYLIDNRQYGQNLASDLNMTLPTDVGQDYSVAISVNATGARPFFQAQLTPQPTSELMKKDGRLFINSRGERWRDTDDSNSCTVATCSPSSPTATTWD